MTYDTLKDVQQYFSSDFLRVNNSEVVNLSKIKSIDKAKFTDYKYLYPDQFTEISSILEKGYVAFNFDRRMRKLVLGIENET